MRSLNRTNVEYSVSVLSVFFTLFCGSLSTECWVKGKIALLQQKVLPFAQVSSQTHMLKDSAKWVIKSTLSV